MPWQFHRAEACCRDYRRKQSLLCGYSCSFWRFGWCPLFSASLRYWLLAYSYSLCPFSASSVSFPISLGEIGCGNWLKNGTMSRSAPLPVLSTTAILTPGSFARCTRKFSTGVEASALIFPFVLPTTSRRILMLIPRIWRTWSKSSRFGQNGLWTASNKIRFTLRSTRRLAWYFSFPSNLSSLSQKAGVSRAFPTTSPTHSQARRRARRQRSFPGSSSRYWPALRG
jgi:hypothetical protein